MEVEHADEGAAAASAASQAAPGTAAQAKGQKAPTAIEKMAAEILERLNFQVGGKLAEVEEQLALARAPGQGRSQPTKPEKYDGARGQADQWCFAMEQYFTVCNITDPHRASFAGAMLTGSALVWWRAASQEAEPIVTWDQFKANLLYTFKHIDNVKLARNRLRSLRQRASVDSYYIEFSKALFEIPGITEDEKMDRFYAGLKQPLQREIILREPSSFNELVRLAHKLDQVLFEAGKWERSELFRRPDGGRQAGRGAIGQYRPNYSSSSNGPTPMELGALQHSDSAGTSRQHARNNLTPAERERLYREGRCFYCKEPGHTASSCSRKTGFNTRAGKAPAR
jgi:hypothetical protein